MIDWPPSELHWTYVDAVDVQAAGHDIAARAIDTPHSGDRTPGAGLEVNGWVIGRAKPVLGVRALTNGSAGETFPLAVKRPDVAADYPMFAYAATSGFSFWAPITEDEGPWKVNVEAILADGTPVVLGEFHGRSRFERHWSSDVSRLITAPDFAIIGTQRGGTTPLHAYLNAHPLVATPATKELHFVTDRHSRGRDWYLGQFPAEVPLGAIIGEATPYALFHPASPQRLRQVAPEARLLVLLRNPVDRAYSHYLLEQSRGEETLPFDMALDAESVRLAGEDAKLIGNPYYVSHAHNHSSYLSRGDYAPQLERWFEAYPKEQFLILRSEDLFQKPEETFARVTSFLGLPPETGISFGAHNRTTGPLLDASIRDRLAMHFAPLNARLAELLAWDQAWD